MPADGIPRCHSPRTETSARPVSKSSSKEDYRSPKNLHIGQDVAHTILSKPMAPMSEMGQSRLNQPAPPDLQCPLRPESGQTVGTHPAITGHVRTGCCSPSAPLESPRPLNLQRSSADFRSAPTFRRLRSLLDDLRHSHREGSPLAFSAASSLISILFALSMIFR
jgi:hypothetical protein